MAAAKLANMQRGGDGSNQHVSKSANLQNSEISQSDAAHLLNVSTRTVAAAAKLANMRQGQFVGNQHVPSANLQNVSQSDAAHLLNVSTRTVAAVNLTVPHELTQARPNR